MSSKKFQISNHKFQTNHKSQIQNLKQISLGFGAWNLVLIWSLVLGIWNLLAPKPAFAGELANQFTIELWVKPTGSAASKAILVKNNEIRLVTDGTGKPLCQVHNGTSWQTAATSSTALTSGQWTHLACTYDKSTLAVYVNGVKRGSTSLSVTVNDTANTFKVGKDDSATYSDFSGFVDDIKIYNYARTQKQIIEDMNAGHPIGGSPVGSQVLYLKFDEGYGTTAHDSSPQANDGTLQPGTGGSNTTAAQMWTNDGKVGKAIEFDGTDDYVETTYSGIIGNNPRTITAWIKSNNTQIQAILSYGTLASGQQFIFTTEGNKIGLRINGANIIYNAPNLNDGNWHYIALSMPSNATLNDISFYMDGKLLTAVSSSVNPTTAINTGSDEVVRIGRNLPNGSSIFFSGLIDEVKIYNAALTEDEIKLDYNQGKAMVMGAVSTDSSGNPSWSASREYCIPGDTATCAPPVLELKFDEKTGTTAYDTSGNGNNGTINGATWKGSAECKSGACLSFDGNDYTSVADAASLDLTQFTVSFWAYHRQLKDYSGLVIKGLDGSENFEVLTFANGTVHAPILWTDGTRTVCNSPVGTATTNMWQYYALTYDGTNRKLYVDGKLVCSDSPGKIPQTNTYEVVIGAEQMSAGSFSRYLDGLIDQVRIYNYARTPAQIAWDYNRGKPVGWWKFDECQGTTLNDAEGNADGTLIVGASGSQTSAGTCTSGNSTDAWYNGRTGKYNSSLNFDGTDDYVSTADITLSSTQNYAEVSFGAWVNPSSTTSKAILVKDNEFRLVTNSSGQALCQVHNGTSWQTAATSSTALSSNTWQFVLCTHDGSTTKVYINGKLKGSASAAANVNNGSAVLEIAKDASLTYGYFAGKIDEVMVFNYALTPAQIKSYYNQGAVRFGPASGTP